MKWNDMKWNDMVWYGMVWYGNRIKLKKYSVNQKNVSLSKSPRF
jgi:hypothetical protein